MVLIHETLPEKHSYQLQTLASLSRTMDAISSGRGLCMRAAVADAVAAEAACTAWPPLTMNDSLWGSSSSPWTILRASFGQMHA